MNKKKYTDEEILTAAEKWRSTICDKLQKENSKRNKKQITSLKSSLKKLKKEFRKQSKNTSDEWNEIWKNVVGEEIFTLTKIKKWHNGFLEIIVENTSLRSELDAFYKDSLIQSIKEIIKDKKQLRGIKFISN